MMLRPARFTGDEPALLKAADVLWRALARAVAGVVLEADGRLSEMKTRRLIRFLDTPQRDFNRAGYIYRERHDPTTDEVTLKFRHPDRYVTVHRDMASGTKGGRTKLEEDIKVPFVPLYNFSTTVGVKPAKALGTLADAAALFPDIRQRIRDSE